MGIEKSGYHVIMCFKLSTLCTITFNLKMSMNGRGPSIIVELPNDISDSSSFKDIMKMILTHFVKLLPQMKRKEMKMKGIVIIMHSDIDESEVKLVQYIW